jgi:hypothetical protein
MTRWLQGENRANRESIAQRSQRGKQSEQPQKVTTVRIPMTAASLDPFWALGFQIY